MSYLNKYTNKSRIPQTEKLDKNQVKNNAGGYVYQISEMEQLKRFLTIGTFGGTYYVNEKKLTKENLEILDKIMVSNPLKAINLAVEISTEGRAPKNASIAQLEEHCTCNADVESSSLSIGQGKLK